MINQLPIPQFCQDAPADEPDNEVRRDRGRSLVSALMIWWFARNDWSHPNFADLADYSLDEKGSIHTSQLSHIRNQKMRMMGLKTLDAFGAVNLVLWSYHNDRPLIKRLTSSVLTPHIEELLQRAEPIMDPISNLPLAQGGWMMVYLGYLQLPVVQPLLCSEEDLRLLAPELGGYLHETVQDFYLLSNVVSKLVVDKARAQKLVAVAAGLDRFLPAQLLSELPTICAVLDEIDEKGRTSSSLLEDIKRSVKARRLLAVSM